MLCPITKGAYVAFMVIHKCCTCFLFIRLHSVGNIYVFFYLGYALLYTKIAHDGEHNILILRYHRVQNN